VIISARKTQLPNSFVIRQRFLPMKPRPAWAAKVLSRIGPVST